MTAACFGEPLPSIRWERGLESVEVYGRCDVGVGISPGCRSLEQVVAVCKQRQGVYSCDVVKGMVLCF